MMVSWKSWSAYAEFAREVRTSRYFAQSATCRRFLDNVRASAKDRVSGVRVGHPFWRAQIGSADGELFVGDETHDVSITVDKPYEPQRMTPNPAVVKSGRLNPMGTAFLYLADKEETAIAEVRPWKGAKVSIGLFEILRECRVINCTEPGAPRFHFGIDKDGKPLFPTKDEWNGIVWDDISWAFAVPVDPFDSGLGYAPTQVLAEVFRDEGYDGIAFRSAMHPEGMNLALFNLNAARLHECYLHDVDSVTYKTAHTGQQYSLKRITPVPAADPPRPPRGTQ